MSRLEVRNATVRFGGLLALDAVSFTLAPGELMLVTGANGAGKSTLLDALSGWIPLATGEIRVDGNRVDGNPPEGFARRGVARTFASGWAFGRLTIDENINLAGGSPSEEGLVKGLFSWGQSPATSGQQAGRDVLRAFGLDGLLARFAKELSGGERKILSIAMALALRPGVLLLDEPLAQLSGVGRAIAINLLRSVLASGTAVVVVEHLLDEVSSLATRRLHLIAGKAAELLPDTPLGSSALEAQVDALAPEAATPGGQADRLSVRELSVHVGGLTLLKDINLDVEEGSYLRVMGGNGSGKSTLLEAVLGLKASTGSRRILGRDATRLAPHDLARLGVAYVPQRGKCLPSLTVRENLLLAGEAVDRPGSAAVESTMDLFPMLKPLLDHPTHVLSAGERQMVALGFGLHREVPLLLLDEPSLGLSPVVWTGVRKELERRRRAGTSLVVVEHRSAQINRRADCSLLLQQGRVAIEENA